jgi:hypothetical protein
MELKNFFQKIFLNSQEFQIPDMVKQTFEEDFKHSLNPEWHKAGDIFEVVFYLEQSEHIASYDKNGILVCLKANLPLQTLPDHIKQNVLNKGELMNAIQVDEQQNRSYELIIRDAHKTRYFLLLNKNGEILKQEKL